MCVQCTHSHKRIARECIVPQGNAQVVQRQRTSHILYNKAKHVAQVVPQGNAHVVQRQRTSHMLYNGNARRTLCTTRQRTSHMLYNRKLINGRIGGRCGRFEEPPLKSGKVDAFLLSDLCYTI